MRPESIIRRLLGMGGKGMFMLLMWRTSSRDSSMRIISGGLCRHGWDCLERLIDLMKAGVGRWFLRPGFGYQWDIKTGLPV